MTTVDVILLGTGTAAQTVAYACREAGWSVAVIDSRPFGGTCQLGGCDPKKALVGVSELVDGSDRMQAKGVATPGLSIGWPDLIRFTRTFTDPAPEQNEQSFAQAGIITQHGRAHFVDGTRVQVGGHPRRSPRGDRDRGAACHLRLRDPRRQTLRLLLDSPPGVRVWPRS